jgi:hypothetical protein
VYEEFWENTMTITEPNVRIMKDPEGPLEQALIEEFLRARDLDSNSLQFLPKDEAKRLLAEASVCAATKLAEIESRAHYVHEMHHEE